MTMVMPTALDATGLASHVMNMGKEMQRAWRVSHTFADRCPRGVRRLLVCGMGGSAGAGDLVSGLAASAGAAAEMSVWRGYGIPSWVDEHTLVVCCSYSGETEETLSAFYEAQARGVPCAVVASGGRLLAEAQQRNLPAFVIRYASPPRHSIAWSLPPVLRLAASIGALPANEARLDAAATQVASELENGLPELAFRVACDLRMRVVSIWGAEFLAPVARRWKNQLNENTQRMAFADELPEANHNTIMGLDSPHGAELAVVLFASQLFHPRVQRRVEVTPSVIDCDGVRSIVVLARGASRLEQVLFMVALGDLVSLWCAAMDGVDAAQIPRIDALKRLLLPPSEAGHRRSSGRAAAGLVGS